MRNMKRRDFLTLLAVAGTTVVPRPAEASSNKLADPPTVNQGFAYKIAKEVWDLSREAWVGRYPINKSLIKVEGVLNLAPTGSGRYLMIKSSGWEHEPSKFTSTSLELIAVDGIDKKTAEGIDNYLAKLGLRYYIPMGDKDKFEEIRKRADNFEISLPGVAVSVIWEEIMDYSKEHKLPVSYLESGINEKLGNLRFVGIRENGGELKNSDLCLFDRLQSGYQRQIIEQVYIPLLTQAVPLLKKEVELVNSRISRDGEVSKIKTPNQIAQMILKQYQIQ